MSEKIETVCAGCGSPSGCVCPLNAEMIGIIRDITDENGGDSVPFLDDAVKHCIAAAEERGRRKGVEERDALLRESERMLQSYVDGGTPREAAQDLLAKLAALAPNRQSVSFRGGSYFDSQQKEIRPCQHGEWPMACWMCQSVVADLLPRDSGKEPKEENAGRWVLPGGGTGFVAPPSICNACGEPLLTRNLFVDDGCPCNSPRGVNVKPAACSLCRIDNCVKPAHRLLETRK